MQPSHSQRIYSLPPSIFFSRDMLLLIDSSCRPRLSPHAILILLPGCPAFFKNGLTLGLEISPTELELRLALPFLKPLEEDLFFRSFPFTVLSPLAQQTGYFSPPSTAGRLTFFMRGFSQFWTSYRVNRQLMTSRGTRFASEVSNRFSGSAISTTPTYC